MTQVGVRSTGNLAGRRVVVTRAPHQAGELAALLSAKGAIAVKYPCIEIQLPENKTVLDEALRAASDGLFEWLVISSANVAWAVAQRAETLKIDLGGQRAAAVGPKTAQVAREMLGIEVELVSPEYTAEALAAAMMLNPGQRVLLPQSSIARPALAKGLQDKGAEVRRVAAYETVIGRGGEDVPALLAAGRIDAITFSSSSTVRNFLGRLEAEGGDRAHLQGVCLAAIGPVTAGTMVENGLVVDLVPLEYTLPALVDSLESYYLKLAPTIQAPANFTEQR